MIFNIGVLVLGISVLTFGIYSYEEDNNFAWYNGSFIFLGILAISTGLVGHLIRYSPLYLFVYEISLYVLLLMQIIFTSLAIKDVTMEHYKENDVAFKFVIIQTVLIIFFCFVLAWWYWKTLASANKVPEKETIQGSSPFLKNNE